jgi:signal peptidase II
MYDMQGSAARKMRLRPIIFYATALLVIILDQLTKFWIRSALAIGETLWEWSIFSIVRIPPNTGAAFGIFRNYQYVLAAFSAISATAIIIGAAYIWKRYPPLYTRLTQFILGLVLGGTVGNLIDRLQPKLGGVTDFVTISIWPSFNIADASIVCGILVFVYYLLRLMKEGKI